MDAAADILPAVPCEGHDITLESEAPLLLESTPSALPTVKSISEDLEHAVDEEAHASAADPTSPSPPHQGDGGVPLDGSSHEDELGHEPGPTEDDCTVPEPWSEGTREPTAVAQAGQRSLFTVEEPGTADDAPPPASTQDEHDLAVLGRHGTVAAPSAVADALDTDTTDDDVPSAPTSLQLHQDPAPPDAPQPHCDETTQASQGGPGLSPSTPSPHEGDAACVEALNVGNPSVQLDAAPAPVGSEDVCAPAIVGADATTNDALASDMLCTVGAGGSVVVELESHPPQPVADDEDSGPDNSAPEATVLTSMCDAEETAEPAADKVEPRVPTAAASDADMAPEGPHPSALSTPAAEPLLDGDVLQELRASEGDTSAASELQVEEEVNDAAHATCATVVSGLPEGVVTDACQHDIAQLGCPPQAPVEGKAAHGDSALVHMSSGEAGAAAVTANAGEMEATDTSLPGGKGDDVTREAAGDEPQPPATAEVDPTPVAGADAGTVAEVRAVVVALGVVTL